MYANLKSLDLFPQIFCPSGLSQVDHLLDAQIAYMHCFQFLKTEQQLL
jgi:hypothetical protein